MVIIAEGLDCTGKTTWAKKFCEENKYEYKVGLKTDIEIEKEKQIEELEEEIASGKDIIYDRSTLIDNFAYWKINPTWECLLHHISKIHTLLEKCLVIHFYIADEERKERMKLRGDEWINESDIEALKESYSRTYNLLGITPEYILLDETADSKVIELVDIMKNNC
jgi:thymidylate kinase